MSISNISSRKLALVSLLTAGALIVTGCSSDGTTDGSSAESINSAENTKNSDTAASSAVGETRTVTDSEGNEVEVPTEPQRIVTLHFAATEALVDLGLTPVGQGSFNDGLLPPEKAEDVKDVPTVNTEDGLQLEAIAALKPDLILVPNMIDPSDIEQLREIAPSYIYTHSGEERANWSGRVAQIADATNQSSKIDELESAMEKRQAEISETYSAELTDRRFAVINSYSEQEVALNSDTSMLGSILVPAGVQWSQQENDIVGDEDGGELTVSLERLNEAVGDADVILYGTDLNQKPTENYENMSESDMFQSLNAVKDSKVYPIGKMTVAGYTDAMATLDMLEELLKDLRG